MPFIVLEGLDGAGKSTQIKLLIEQLTLSNKRVEYLHFPRFDTPVYGELIARFLRGELGDLREVNPYLVALIYAGDRAAAAPQIREWLAAGRYVVVDRYVHSNVAFQCAKVDDPTAREQLRAWIVDLEYGQNAIPQPDLSLFLDVPFAFTRQKLEETREGEDRSYLQGKADIHEASLSFQERVRLSYLDQVASDPSVRVIPCGDSFGVMLPPEEIFERLSREIYGL